MLVTPETRAMGLDREESLMMIGDTMIIPIAPAGAGAQKGAPIGFRGTLPNPYMERTGPSLHYNLAKFMGTGAPRKLD